MTVVVVVAVSAVPAAASVDDDDGDVVAVAVAVAVVGERPCRFLLLPRQHGVIGVEDVLQDKDDVGADEVPVFSKKREREQEGERGR